MTQFVVSARKYRPTTFKDVISQSHITATLKNAIATQQLAHAFLFVVRVVWAKRLVPVYWLKPSTA